MKGVNLKILKNQSRLPTWKIKKSISGQTENILKINPGCKPQKIKISKKI